MIAVSRLLTAFPTDFTPQTLTELVSSISAPITDAEEALFQQKGSKEVPFAGMDRSGRAVCRKHTQGICPFGQTCPLRHLIGEKAVVCKHWLRGLCKKGDQCEFLHEYDLTKMPECFFFSKYMACSNRECPFRHIDPESKMKDCPWYDRGFCRHGPYCKHRHRRRVMCPKFFWPVSVLKVPPNSMLNNKRAFNQQIVCHNCHERGHKATHCPHLPGQPSNNPADGPPMKAPEISMYPEQKNLAEVTCYKCGEKGHYANRCHKGALAFLSNTAHLAQEQREKDEREQGRFTGMPR
ncbi:unnamed protein product [Caenorhabditis auriculariae]|uniref:Cleavage and polyadenylation specificity factor subunit 4 n=1 Tax=Caenorhabditis auriculariae TaxID=2777116 RepID=A0A8S1HID3_9PELO|nr:unnamed protein product [Caenorhabditis auriculariae]